MLPLNTLQRSVIRKNPIYVGMVLDMYAVGCIDNMTALRLLNQEIPPDPPLTSNTTPPPPPNPPVSGVA